MADLIQIKKRITDRFISNEHIQRLYDLTPGNSFEQEFSSVSVENIMFDNFAYEVFLLTQTSESNAANSRPQNQPNLKAVVLNFHDGLELVWKDGQYMYDLTNVSEPDNRKIIKRCAVLESDSGLVIKITGQNGPLSADQVIRVFQYLKMMKVPGGKIDLINADPDLLRTTLNVYVDPLIIDLTTGRLLNTTDEIYPVKAAINDYLDNLQFNGAFVKDFFRTTLKAAEGIDLVQIVSMEWQYASYAFEPFGEWQVPEAGYFKILPDDLTINYLSNVLVNN